tara:strand:- start:370 stop:867 length:498 start_codon:yes stop_codon:yes gene_type:complete
MNNVIIIPNYDEILDLEKKSFKEGSGISDKEIIGKWRFKYVWKKGQVTIDNVASSLLQVLSASLELSQIEKEDEENSIEIKNSISFGLLSIVFKGEAFLKGKRPLLYFYFKNVFVYISGFNIFKTSLQKLDLKRMPFFSLIAVEKNKNWLCARGKGGGLAIWFEY